MKKTILLSFVICILLVASLAIVSADRDNDYKKSYDKKWDNVKAGSGDHNSLDKSAHKWKEDSKWKEKDEDNKNKKITICHYTSSENNPYQTISVSKNALKAHLKHGDSIGPCEETPIEPFCGDGILNAGEECDDGNLMDGDGCSALCITEETPIEPFCGDGLINLPEETCDDGNDINGDGCSAKCNNEIFMEYFFPKDDEGISVKDGTWGGMNFTDLDFIFKGYYLNPGTNYTLLRFTEYSLVNCLKFGMADTRGDLALFGDMKEGGQELWLVLSADVSCNTNTMAGGDEDLLEYLYAE